MEQLIQLKNEIKTLEEETKYLPNNEFSKQLRMRIKFKKKELKKLEDEAILEIEKQRSEEKRLTMKF